MALSGRRRREDELVQQFRLAPLEEAFGRALLCQDSEMPGDHRVGQDFEAKPRQAGFDGSKTEQILRMGSGEPIGQRTGKSWAAR